MARKVVNRRELRRQNDAAEESEDVEDIDDDSDDGDEKPKAKKAKKAAVKKKPRTKTPKEVRLKAYWGVFNQSLKRVALFEYSEKKQAERKAGELSTSQKTPHFVQPVKEVITE